MGRRKSISLLKLAYKRLPRKRFIVTRMKTLQIDESTEPDVLPQIKVKSVEGYYEYNKVVTLPSGRTVKMCIDQQGEMFSKPVLQPSLARMGLYRNEYDKIVPIKRKL